MARGPTFGIVGAGLAGARAAQALREGGFDGRVVLLGAESERPYERPPLSKGLLLGSTQRREAYVHDAGWYEANDVELRTATRVTGIDRDARQVVLGDDERLGYDKLLLATGATPRRLAVPGAGLEGVWYLRTLADSDRIAEVLTDQAHLVVIGAGWIGLEIAAAARQRGAAVTVVEVADLPLQRVLGDEVARVFADLHRSHDVAFHFGAEVLRLRGSGRVSSVLLTDGTQLGADTVVVGVGVRPNVELAAAAGLTVENGIVTDALLRTSDPHIYAAGDVANAYHPLLGRHIRVEHWANALNGGPAVARSMLGQRDEYVRLPYFFSDQYDLGMENSGWAAPRGYDRVVLRGDPVLLDGKAPEFVAFWVNGHGRVLAGMNANAWGVTDQVQALVRAGHAGLAVDLVKLADPQVPLDHLLGRAVRSRRRDWGPEGGRLVPRLQQPGADQPVGGRRDSRGQAGWADRPARGSGPAGRPLRPEMNLARKSLRNSGLHGTTRWSRRE
ncbi:3-phenylpropionate/trans-cinnamate dioxygenase ferredoxin reductase subunit [Micromonospora rhizosphaerae]|uniref:3-phenylpropionate/trans-cinnamate dioxygenase ferredoxin reductase subunit n=1 Tax=Micromonospora rhizosphaerae TaxID=568872 RepID=A0A1C6T4F6_9ACTN|nr:FAD-dependent oxidoreductase [Micromonospora rhizosphaerae]SCL36668.1 3-phenylpropionate/trans-cinnamate dioxygenase ferredoxin reductase subunit [Micromonospora rhizosphaerae]